MNQVDYSIVIPVYNSETTLEELFTRIKLVFDGLNNSFEVIFVEDCGSDNSWQIIELLKETYPHLIVAIKMSRNFGQHNALMCGFNFARGNYIITIDDDLQNPPEEIPKLIHQLNETGAELVYGVYEKKNHHGFRNFSSGIVQSVVRFVFKTSGDITSFRLLTSNLCKKIIKHHQNFVYLEGLLHWHTQYISRVTVLHHERKEGKSGYTLKKLLHLATNLLFNFTTIPLRLLIYFGAFSSFVSFLAGAIFIFRKFLYDVPLGFTAIVVSIYFSSSIVLLVIGIIGEYLNRLYTLQNDKPQYSIMRIYNI